MRDFNWLKEGSRIVFKTEPFDIWRTGSVKNLVEGKRAVWAIRDRNNRCDVEPVLVKYEYIVGEATDRFTPFPFYWGNVLEHLTEEAKENL